MNPLLLADHIRSYIEHLNNELVDSLIEEEPNHVQEDVRPNLLAVLGILSSPLIPSLVEECNAGQVKALLDNVIETSTQLRIQKEKTIMNRLLEEAFAVNSQSLIDVA